jgi:ribA/ribD-fused uncharacterized protein
MRKPRLEPIPCIVRKVKDQFGCLGNMSRHEIIIGDEVWRTSEALFQSLRFAADNPIRRKIRKQSSPIQAKLCAQANAEHMVVRPTSAEDVANMDRVLRLKVAQHVDVYQTLRSTGDRLIIEDVSARARGNALFWGAAWDRETEEWKGQNVLGALWMQIRSDLLAKDRDFE